LLPDVVIGCSAGINFEKLLKIFLFYLILEDRFGQRRPADVSQADKQYFYFLHTNLTKNQLMKMKSQKYGERVTKRRIFEFKG
jgi:hypothetical protein